VTGFATPLEYFVCADFPHQMSYLRRALLYDKIGVVSNLQLDFQLTTAVKDSAQHLLIYIYLSCVSEFKNATEKLTLQPKHLAHKLGIFEKIFDSEVIFYTNQTV
jgi:hypothetical protein